MRHTLALLATLAVFCTGACATGPKPVVITKPQYVAVTVSPELLDTASCPWPVAGQITTEADLSDYLLAGFEAWKCQLETRKTIKTQSERQAAEIAARK